MTLLLLSTALGAEVTWKTHEGPAGSLEYAVLVPDGKGPHRAVLALPPGDQSRMMVDAAVMRWADPLLEAGWLIVSPAAPGAPLYDPAVAKRLPGLLDEVAKEHGIQTPWAMYGISNGGVSALYIGAMYPERFRSITVMPGAVKDPAMLAALGEIPVTLVVGGQDDQAWVQGSRDADAWLKANGGRSELVVDANQGHMVFMTVTATQLAGWLEKGGATTTRKKRD